MTASMRSDPGVQPRPGVLGLGGRPLVGGHGGLGQPQLHGAAQRSGQLLQLVQAAASLRRGHCGLQREAGEGPGAEGEVEEVLGMVIQVQPGQGSSVAVVLTLLCTW